MDAPELIEAKQKPKRRKRSLLSAHKQGQRQLTTLATSKQGQKAIFTAQPELRAIPKPLRRTVTRHAIAQSGGMQRKQLGIYGRAAKPFLKHLNLAANVEYVAPEPEPIRTECTIL